MSNEANNIDAATDQAGRFDGLVMCRHTVTKGNHCVECGVKVFEVETRRCGNCQQFRLDGHVLGHCKKKYMTVTSDMRVTFKVIDGTCFE